MINKCLTFASRMGCWLARWWAEAKKSNRVCGMKAEQLGVNNDADELIQVNKGEKKLSRFALDGKFPRSRRLPAPPLSLCSSNPTKDKLYTRTPWKIKNSFFFVNREKRAKIVSTFFFSLFSRPFWHLIQLSFFSLFFPFLPTENSEKKTTRGSRVDSRTIE